MFFVHTHVNKKQQMPRKSNPAGRDALKKIIGMAQEYKSHHPGTPWKNCIKHAGEEYRSKYGTKKSTTRKKSKK